MFYESTNLVSTVNCVSPVQPLLICLSRMKNITIIKLPACSHLQQDFFGLADWHGLLADLSIYCQKKLFSILTLKATDSHQSDGVKVKVSLQKVAALNSSQESRMTWFSMPHPGWGHFGAEGWPIAWLVGLQDGAGLGMAGQGLWCHSPPKQPDI